MSIKDRLTEKLREIKAEAEEKGNYEKIKSLAEEALNDLDEVPV